MNPELRRSVAHLAVDDVDDPVLDDESAHHLCRVLRARLGEPVTVTDGEGAWRACVVTADGVAPSGPPVIEPPPPASLSVAVAVPKADRPEWLVRKVTEIGVDRLVWLHCARSSVCWDESKAKTMRDRLGRVAREASLQSRRVRFPSIEGPVPASDVLPSAAVAEPGGRALAAGDHLVAVGPEGGWDPAELDLAESTVDLGPTVLRVETAALVAAAELIRLHRTTPALPEL